MWPPRLGELLQQIPEITSKFCVQKSAIYMYSYTWPPEVYIFKQDLFTHTTDKPFSALILSYGFMVVLNQLRDHSHVVEDLANCSANCSACVCPRTKRLLWEWWHYKIMLHWTGPWLGLNIVHLYLTIMLWCRKKDHLDDIWKALHNHHWFLCLFKKKKNRSTELSNLSICLGWFWYKL